MVDADILRRRIDALLQYLGYLEPFGAEDRARFAFAILARHSVLDDDLARRLQSWAGMRNVLVHVYLDIDHGLTWDAIRNDLGDLRRLAEIAAAKL